MNTIIITLIITLSLIIFIEIAIDGGNNKSKKPKYRYMRKQFFLTRAEHAFYDALITAVGDKFHVFAQVHLSTILDHKEKGQDWRAAFRHINGKSVDFVLCDKAYISPKLAIELDDKSHERPDRKQRDREVERILANAGIPLLRFENRDTFNSGELAEKIFNTLTIIQNLYGH